MPKNIAKVLKLSVLAIGLNFILTNTACTGPMAAPGKIERVSPAATRTRTLQHGALLVCSYADNRCRNILLEGAILRSEFEARLPSLAKHQEIIFYCG